MLAEVTEALAAFDRADREREEARRRFAAALLAAHDEGHVPYSTLGRLVGMTRQRVAQIVAEERRRDLSVGE